MNYKKYSFNLRDESSKANTLDCVETDDGLATMNAKNDFRFDFVGDDERIEQKKNNLEKPNFLKTASKDCNVGKIHKKFAIINIKNYIFIFKNSWTVPTLSFHSPKKDASLNTRFQANTPRKQSPFKNVNIRNDLSFMKSFCSSKI